MKICYLADAGSIHTQKWVKYFADKGHEVHLISIKPFVQCDLENVKLHLIKKVKSPIRNPIRSSYSYAINSFSVLKQVKRLLKEIEPDILHAHYLTTYGTIGALTGFHPFILTAWGSDVLISPKKSKIFRWAVKFALGKADLITCDADHIKEPLINVGAKPGKIRIVYFGIDTKKFKPREGSENINEELGISDSPTVISLRNLAPVYDIKSLIASVPMVSKEIPGVQFVIAGKGPQETKLKELTRSLNVSDNVKFIGSIPNDELPKYLSSMDVYVSTSLSDAGLAASTAEAMACGLPVVITDFGDNRKWIEDGESGFIVPLKDPKALAEKIIYLLKNKDIRREFGMRNRKIIEEKNNYYREMEKMENSYIELTGGHKS